MAETIIVRFSGHRPFFRTACHLLFLVFKILWNREAGKYMNHKGIKLYLPFIVPGTIFRFTKASGTSASSRYTWSTGNIQDEK
jgi:hypothetical protein